VSQHYGPPRPVAGIALILFILIIIIIIMGDEIAQSL
jgi:hypothetical protein